ncbi:MAG TPA: M56 family metallopeptidase [Acidobacteriaceae bacterium]|nr:M56 family metallopeptidase [Acidobacteriaceae bacterium]
MNLPYALRLVCLLAVVAGGMQLVLQLTLALNGGTILRMLQTANARQRERRLYFLQVGPALAALLFAGAIFLPQYLLHEPNGDSERVSWISVCAACGVVLWFGSAVIDAGHMAVCTLRFIRASRLAGLTTETQHAGLPVITLPNAGHFVALAGFLKPVIFVSDDLLQPGGLDKDALRLALDHERSHARRLDNWKLLSLRCLPRFFGPTGGGWFRQWQMAAEFAADDEAAGPNPARRLLLAETLLKAARFAPPARTTMIYTALTSGGEELSERIDRLLRPKARASGSPRQLVPAITVIGLSFVAASAAIVPWVYGISEWILHLN